MPSRNTVKIYVEGGYYHVYNRGVDKRTIFEDDLDYKVFLHLVKTLLSPVPPSPKHPLTEVTGFNPVRLRPLTDTLYKEVDLVSFCLMPNHFHLLIRQSTINGLTKFMKRLATSYVMYFNKRNERTGHLFQGIYKAINVDADVYLLHLSRYIHLNPLDLTGMNLVKCLNYPYSSFLYFLGKKKAPWIKPNNVLEHFKSARRLVLRDYFSYQSFVEDYKLDAKEIIGALAIE